MGHRALVAYQRPDEKYNLHYSHWGGCNLRLKTQITEAAPFGGTGQNHPWTTTVYAHFQTASSTELPELEDTSRPATDVKPEPLETVLSLEEIITNQLDYHLYEAFYVVSQSFDVTAYRTLWLGFSLEAESIERSPTDGHGILITVRWHGGEPIDDGYLRGRFDGKKSILGDFIDRGIFTESQATTYLLQGVLSTNRAKSDYHVRRKDR